MLDGSAATHTDDLSILAGLTGTGRTHTSIIDELIERARAIGKTDPGAALRLFERAWAILEAAGCLQDVGQYGEAMTRLSQALPLFQTLGDEFGMASCRNIAGIIELDWSNFETAIRELTSAVEGFRLAEKRDLEAAALYNLGKVFLRLGDYATTLDYFLRCAEIEESLAEPFDLALTYGSISSVCRDLGRYDAALEFAMRGLSEVDPDADRRLLSTVLTEVGLSLAAAGRWDDALD